MTINMSSKPPKNKEISPEEAAVVEDNSIYQEPPPPPMAVPRPPEADPYDTEPIFDLRGMINKIGKGEGEGKVGMQEVLMMMLLTDQMDAKRDRAERRRIAEDLRNNPPPPPTSPPPAEPKVDVAAVVTDALEKATAKFENIVLKKDLDTEEKARKKAETELKETSTKLVTTEKELSETKEFLTSLDDKVTEFKEKLGDLSEGDKKSLEKTLAKTLTIEAEKMMKQFIEETFADKRTGPATTPEGKPDYIRIVHKIIDIGADLVKKMPETGYVPEEKEVEDMEIPEEDEETPVPPSTVEVPPAPEDEIIDVEFTETVSPPPRIPAPVLSEPQTPELELVSEDEPEELIKIPVSIEQPDESEKIVEEENEKRDEEKSFSCDICGKTFDNKKSLRGHKTSAHRKGKTT